VYDTPHGSLHYHPEPDLLYGRFGGVTVRCKASRGLAVFSCQSFAERDLYLATHPLLTVCLMELLERRALFSLHAACLADAGGRGLVLSGTSGAGKSTLAMALARAGWAFLSDDVVFLAIDQLGAVSALGFADAVGVTDYARRRFSELHTLGTDSPPAGFPKRLARIEDLFGAAPSSSCTPIALVFPEIVRDRASHIEPLDPAEALLRLVPDVLLTEPAATQAHLAAIAALLGQVRCYELASGPDVERTAALLAQLV
jgi:hypothetical protein